MIATIEQLLEIYVDDPVAFVEDILGADPDDWQRAVLADLANNPRVSVRSGQGVGKTALESWAVIWFLTCRPFPKVICTAPTKQQLYEVLWAEIAKWLNDSKVSNILKWTKTKVYMVGYADRWFATAKTATRPENMQGFHEDNMLFVCDEASGIADPIMEAILGTLSGEDNKLLMCGNPTKISGVFYDSHNKDRGDYKSHKVSSLDSKRTSKENIAMLEKKYRKDSDVYRVRVLGEFPKAESDAFIPLEFVELSTAAELEVDDRILHIGVDVARFGDDETVIAPRIKNKVYTLQTYSKQDTMVTAGWVIRTVNDFFAKFPYMKRAIVNIDDDGVGGGVTDRLKEVIREENLPIQVNPIHNGSAALDPHYANRGTECWADLRDILEENFSGQIQGKDLIVELPNDEKLISQLSTRKYKMTSVGKIALERKEDMKKRGLPSPDRADAVVLSFVSNRTATTPTGVIVGKTATSDIDW